MVALVLIVLGIFLLWDNVTSLLWYILPDHWVSDFIYSVTRRLPRIIISLIVIFLGLKLIGGKKKELEQEKEKEKEEDVVEYTDIPVIPPVEEKVDSDENA